MTQAAKVQEFQLTAKPKAIKEYNATLVELQQKAVSGEITIETYNKGVKEAQIKLLGAAQEVAGQTTLVEAMKEAPFPEGEFKTWGEADRKRLADKILDMSKRGMNDKQIQRELKVCSLSYVFKVRSRAGLKAVSELPKGGKPSQKKTKAETAKPKEVVQLTDDAFTGEHKPLGPSVEREARFREKYPTRQLDHRPALFNFPQINRVLQMSFHEPNTDTWIVLTSKATWEEQEPAVAAFLTSYMRTSLVLIDSDTLNEFKPHTGPVWLKAMCHRNYIMSFTPNLGD